MGVVGLVLEAEFRKAAAATFLAFFVVFFFPMVGSSLSAGVTLCRYQVDALMGLISLVGLLSRGTGCDSLRRRGRRG